MSSKKTTAERMHALFAGNEDHHGVHGEPTLDPQGGVKWEIRSTAKTLRGPATVQLWERHLSEKDTLPLGVVPITNDSRCVWGSGDIDDYDLVVSDVIARVQDAKFPLLPCRSKSGGLHLFLFASEPVEAGLMQSTLREMMAHLGYADCEIFPKQTKLLSDRGEKGSWIVMPYCGTTYGGKLRAQAGLKRTGAEMTIEEFLHEAERMRLKPDDFTKFRANGDGRARSKKSGKEKERPPFSDGPPCAQHLVAQAGGVKQGGQNNFLFHVGVYYKRKFPDDWKKHLEEAASKFCDPPYPIDKLAVTIKSLERKEYQYKCKDQPMVAHCDSMQCRARKFGVGAGGTYPQIQSISKLNSEPPLWFVDVEGAKIPMSTEDLQNYHRFHRLCIEHCHKSFAIISQNVWFGVLNDVLQNLEILETSDDLAPGSQFLELLETFLTNRQRGRVQEDLAQGRPWEDEDNKRHYFQLAPLQKFLEREGMKDLARHRGRITSLVRKLGGGQYGMSIKGAGFRSLWWVPSDAVRKLEEAATPRQQGGEEL